MNSLIPLVDVPEGTCGKWSVEKFTISETDASRYNMFLAFKPGGAARSVKPGTYTKLMAKGAFDPIMSDTPAEIRDHFWFVRNASGKVLVTGLGLGVVTNALLLKPDVGHVTVIEVEPDIIKLVGGHYQAKFGDRLEIIQADAYKWVPEPPRFRGMFDYAWHDIWPSICSDNWNEIKKIKRHYQHWVTVQECWVEEEVKYVARRGY
jgi:hypothetical protein